MEGATKGSHHVLEEESPKNAKSCGKKRFLTDHMKELWANINSSPTTFKLPEDTNEDEDGENNMEGDRPVMERPEVERSLKQPKKNSQGCRLITSLRRLQRKKL